VRNFKLLFKNPDKQTKKPPLYETALIILALTAESLGKIQVLKMLANFDVVGVLTNDTHHINSSPTIKRVIDNTRHEFHKFSRKGCVTYCWSTTFQHGTTTLKLTSEIHVETPMTIISFCTNIAQRSKFIIRAKITNQGK
jgi:hypothetical protein